jgi:hypothetical protein
MSDYKLLRDGGVYHRPTGRHIPADPANRHWQEYQRWLAAGNVPEPADVPARQAASFGKLQPALPRRTAAITLNRSRIYG